MPSLDLIIVNRHEVSKSIQIALNLCLLLLLHHYLLILFYLPALYSEQLNLPRISHTEQLVCRGLSRQAPHFKMEFRSR